VRLGGLALGAAKSLRHAHEIAPLGFGHESGEREQLAALLLREVRELPAVGLDRAQHAHAGADVVRGQCRVRDGRWSGRIHRRILRRRRP
jgi:hypothetical protein